MVTPILEKLDQIVSGVDRHASELAIPRIRKECRTIESRIADARDYIDSWRDFESERAGSAVTTGVILGLICSVLSLCGGLAHWAVAVVGIILSVGMGVVVVLVARPNTEEIEAKVRRAKRTIDDLEASLARRRKELRQHYENVRL